jgi:hypothetical protein
LYGAALIVNQEPLIVKGYQVRLAAEPSPARKIALIDFSVKDPQSLDLIMALRGGDENALIVSRRPDSIMKRHSRVGLGRLGVHRRSQEKNRTARQ